MNTLRYRKIIATGLKVAIVLLALAYIVRKLAVKNDFSEMSERIAGAIGEQPLIFTAVLLLMPLNWLLEAWKWKILASREQPVSLRLALQGVLAGVTAGTASPNRVGEFAGRIFILPEGNRLNLLVLSAISSFCQVMVTVLAGIWALFLSSSSFFPDRFLLSDLEKIWLWILVPLTAGIISFAISFLRHSKKISVRVTIGDFLKVTGLSAARYAVYALQFALLLRLVAAHYNFSEALTGVCICYLLVTIIPTFSVTELLVRGSVAGIVFSDTQLMGGGNGAVFVAMLLWLVNVALPSLAGTVFVFRLKFFRQDDRT